MSRIMFKSDLPADIRDLFDSMEEDSDQEVKQCGNQQPTKDGFNPPLQSTEFPMATEETQESKTFNEVEELLKEMHSEDGSNNIIEGNETFQEDNSQISNSICTNHEQNQPPKIDEDNLQMNTSNSICTNHEQNQPPNIDEVQTNDSTCSPIEYEPEQEYRPIEENQTHSPTSPVENQQVKMIEESQMNRSTFSIENDESTEKISDEAIQENELTSNYCRSKSISPIIHETQDELDTTLTPAATQPTDMVENVEGDDMELEEPTTPVKNAPSMYEIINEEDTENVYSNPSSVKNGCKSDDIQSNEERDESVYKINRSERVHKSYNGIRKDNKEELGRALEFIDRNMINLTFRVSDTEYKIDECKLIFSCVKKSTDDSEYEGVEVATIKKNTVSCFEDTIQKFMLDSLNSYRARLMKELNPERDGEYETMESLAPSESGRSMPKQQTAEKINPARSTRSPTCPLSQVKIQELPKKLVKRIKYKTHSNLSSSDSDNVDTRIPTIPGMKTVPLKIPPSKEVAGYLFVSLKVHSNFMYYYPKVEALDQIVEATNCSPTMADVVSNCSMYSSNSNLSTMSTSPLDGTTSDLKSSKMTEIIARLGLRSSGDGDSAESKPDGRKKLGALFAQIQENVDCRKPDKHRYGCCCGKTAKMDKPEKVELRDVKPISTMVDCDDCGVTFRNGANHKCSKRGRTKMEDKIYSCEVCDRAFSKQAHLSNHMRSHKDYMKATVKCNVCHQRFRKKGEYAAHRAEHHPVETKEFPCDECGETFKTAYRLNKHKRICHSTDSEPEMDIRCVNCNGMFNLAYYRSTHLNECSMGSPQDDNSRTNGTVQVTMRKPVAKRSGPLFNNDKEESDVEYLDECVLEAFEDRKSNCFGSEKSSVKSKGSGKKRRFMNLDAPTSESETEEPPTKFYGVTRGNTSDGSEYIGQEELSFLYDGQEEEEENLNGANLDETDDFDMGEFIKHK